jgi:hypothetical protein
MRRTTAINQELEARKAAVAPPRGADRVKAGDVEKAQKQERDARNARLERDSGGSH